MDDQLHTKITSSRRTSVPLQEGDGIKWQSFLNFSTAASWRHLGEYGYCNKLGVSHSFSTSICYEQKASINLILKI